MSTLPLCHRSPRYGTAQDGPGSFEVAGEPATLFSFMAWQTGNADESPPGTGLYRVILSHEIDCLRFVLGMDENFNRLGQPGQSAGHFGEGRHLLDG